MFKGRYSDGGKRLYSQKKKKEQAALHLEVLNEIYIAGDELQTFENLLKKIRELSKIANDE